MKRAIFALFTLFSANLTFAQQTELGNTIGRFFVGETVSVLEDAEGHQERIRRLEGLRDLYANRANSCEQDVSSINLDLISPQLHDDIINNNTFRMINEIHRELDIQLRPGILYGAYRPNYRDFSCSDMLEREGLDNLPRTLGIPMQTAAIKSQLCANYDRMIQCFRSAEDIMLEESVLIYQGPRYYQMEYFDENFVRENFSNSVSQ